MKMINIEKTGKRIMECIDANSSVKEVAKHLGLTLWAVYKWTYGMSLPTIDNFVNLSDILGVTIEDLLVVEEV